LADAKASATPPSTGVPKGTGVLQTAGAVPGRRIFVDKRTVGQTPGSVTVACGTHLVRIGSSGVARNVDVPCGGEINVAAH
jgi:serine/threonine-protein kinase